MDVGVIGSGIVGRTLGRGFTARNHSVTLGTRSPEREDLQAWARETGARLGSFADAADAADVVVLATAWDGTESALSMAGPDRLAGKLVLDATNPLDYSAGTPPGLAVSGDDSAGERVQRMLPGAHVVKCFNIAGNRLMVDPDLPGGPPTMFIAGDDEAAKARTIEILHSFGWEAADLGGIVASRWLEGIAMAWIWYGFRTGTWNHAFKLLGGNSEMAR
jgi:predicted dinucleotide-binding enzyme